MKIAEENSEDNQIIYSVYCFILLLMRGLQ